MKIKVNYEVKDVPLSELAKADTDEAMFANLRREMIENNRREIDRRLRLYVQAQIAMQFRPCRSNVDKAKLALNDFWAYIMPILEN